MSEIKYCQQCRNTYARWGDDPLQIICNECYNSIQKQHEQGDLEGKTVCLNCLYWHPGAGSGSGQCRNSFSANHKSFTGSSEYCSQFLSI
jgi:hypothetical protein